MISSNVATFGLSGSANYAAAKAGLIGLVRVLALEGAASGIRANAAADRPHDDQRNDPIPGLDDRFHATRLVFGTLAIRPFRGLRRMPGTTGKGGRTSAP